MSTATNEDVKTALKSFITFMDTSQMASELRVDEKAARRIWKKARRKIVAERLTKEASLEFCAELDLLFEAAAREAAQQLITYKGEAAKLTGYAAVLRQLTELQRQRYSMRQDLGLVPTVRAPNKPAPQHKGIDAGPADTPESSKPSNGESAEPENTPELVDATPAPTPEELDAEIQALVAMKKRLYPKP